MHGNARRTASDLTVEVAAATDLAEGPEAVRAMLWNVHRRGAVPVRELARAVSLPVPVVAAVRRELERQGVLERRGGIQLTEAGTRLVRDGLGMCSAHHFDAAARVGRAQLSHPVAAAVLAELTDVAGGRPSVDVRLDQSHGTPETQVRRAVLMYESDALEGRDVAVLGDDDLLSVALALFRRAAAPGGPAPGRIVALDTDERLVDYVDGVSAERDLGIESVVHDLRDPLPEALAGQFDVFATDPPYTVAGLELFVSRAVRALRPGRGRQGFISFAHKSPEEMVSVQAKLVEMGLCLRRVVPDFNRYEGSQVLAGSSQMMHVVTTARTRRTMTGRYDGQLYTAELGQSPRRPDG
jgi:predicted methyltransferase